MTEKELPRLGIDDFTLKCWDICDDDIVEGSDGWTFRIVSDQWFRVSASCGHKIFVRNPNYTQIEETLAEMLEEIKAYHANL